jgi:Cu(I)/Ag(I) efflux system membrane fusion protein
VRSSADAGGSFRAARVTVGREESQHIEILSGLEEGQSVVVSGQFLIDSEANLTGQLERLAPPADAQAAQAPAHEHPEHDHSQQEHPPREPAQPAQQPTLQNPHGAEHQHD